MRNIFVNLQNIFIYWFKADGFLETDFFGMNKGDTCNFVVCTV